MKKHGFTLIELLTVIAIIGILAAILIPVVGRVRASARNSVCQSNLRQWHSALLLHAADHDDSLINVRYYNLPTHRLFWSGRLAEYMNMVPPVWGMQSPTIHDTVAECPEVPWRDTSTYISYGASGTDDLSQALAITWDRDEAVSGMPFTAVEPRTIVFGDAGPTYDRRNWHLGWRGSHVAYRHNDRANFVLMGGAVLSFHVNDPPEENLWRRDL